MSVLQPIWTRAGLIKLTNAQTSGVALEITHVGLGRSRYEPTSSATELGDEVIRVPVLSWQSDGYNQISIVVPITSATNFNVGEVGFYAGNTLVMVYSQTTVLTAMVSGIDLAVQLTIIVEPETLTNITVAGPILYFDQLRPIASLLQAVAALQFQTLDDRKKIEALQVRVSDLENARLAETRLIRRIEKLEELI